jgi:hypothetical protein
MEGLAMMMQMEIDMMSGMKGIEIVGWAVGILVIVLLVVVISRMLKSLDECVLIA